MGQQSRVLEGVTVLRDLTYATVGERELKLDLYLPKEAPKPCPLIVWVHGGGWQNGTKANCRPAMDFLAEGYAVASLDYRLTDVACFPAQIQDCKAGIRWLRANASEYQLDPNRFIAWGSSAGGHLVALLGTSGGVAEFDVGDHLDLPSNVQAVIDYYGPSDLTAMVQTPGYQGHAREGSPESKLVGGAVLQHPDEAAKASPVTYVDADDPPFLIVHGSNDPVVPPDQSQRLHDALTKAGAKSELHFIEGAKHGGREFGRPETIGWVKAFLNSQLAAGRAGGAQE